MPISGLTTLSLFTDKAPVSPTYMNAKWAEVEANLSRLSAAAQSLSDVTASAQSSVWSTEGRWHVRAFGALGATGVPTVDDTTAINNAYSHASNAGGGAVHFSGLSYNVLNVAVAPNTVTYLNGATLYKNTGAASTHVMEVKGVLSTSSATLASHASVRESRVTVVALGSLTTGQTVLIRDLQYVVGSSGRNQEIASIHSIPGGRVAFAHPLLSTYSSLQTPEVVVFTPARGAIHGPGRLVLDADSGTSGGGLYIDLADGFLVQGVEVVAPNDDAGIYVQRSRRVTVDGCLVRNAQNRPTAGYGYGILVAESAHEILVDRCRVEMCADNPISTAAQYVTYSNNQIIGMHGTGIDVHGRGCKHIVLDGNTIVGSGGQSIAIGQTSLIAADVGVRVTNNQIFYSGGGGITVAGSATTRMEDVTLEGNRIYAPGHAGGTTYAGVLASYTSGLRLYRNHVSGLSIDVVYGLSADVCDNVEFVGNEIDNMLASRNAIRYRDCTNVLVQSNSFRSCLGAQILAQNSNTSVRIFDNVGDGTINVGSGESVWVGRNWFAGRLDPSVATDGQGVEPAFAFQSERSLGWYRSGVSSMAPSYGTVDLASNAVRLSMRTVAAASLDSTTLAVNEVAFSVGGASGASLAIRSGGTIWYFHSSASTLG